MALIGEGDPRWLVSDRADGRNVNSWHWEEKDISGWAKPLLRAYIENLTLLDNEIASFKSLAADKLDGDFSVNVRKGKLIFVYDIELTLKWEATLKDTNKKCKGHFESNFDTEDYDSIDITVKSEGFTDAETKLKMIGKSSCVPALRSKMVEFLKEMRERVLSQNAANSAPPPAAASSAAPSASAATTTAAAAAPAPAPVAAPVAAAKPKESASKEIRVEVNVSAPQGAVYETLLDSGRLSAVTQSPVEIKNEVGSSFSMFNKNVTGEITSLDAPKRIVQKWRSASWAQGVFSTVTFDIEPAQGGTKVVMTQKGVPADDHERTTSGWTNLFWEPMRMLFGNVRLGGDVE